MKGTGASATRYAGGALWRSGGGLPSRTGSGTGEKMRDVRRWLGMATLIVLASCTSTAGRLRSQFAEEYRCSEGAVTVTEQGGTLYRVTGCGRTTEYVCSTFAGGGERVPCEELNVRRKIPPRGNPRPFPEPIERHVPSGGN